MGLPFKRYLRVDGIGGIEGDEEVVPFWDCRKRILDTITVCLATHAAASSAPGH